MAIKSARESFRKDDIIEILKRNVALYKDEKEFVDYIVNLAMYLMDQYYGSRGLEFDGGAAMDSDYPDLDDSMIKGPAPVPTKDDGGPNLPPTVEEIARRKTRPQTPPAITSAPGVSVPGTNAFDSGPAMPATPRDLRRQQEEIAAAMQALRRDDPRREARKTSPRDPNEDKSFDVEAAPLVTPVGDAMRDKQRGKEAEQGPQFHRSAKFDKDYQSDDLDEDEKEKDGPYIDIKQQGRARIYRVVRPYKSGTQIETPCPICGAMVPVGEKRCLGCGHIM